MAAEGASGPTRQAMLRALGLDAVDETTVQRAYQRLETLLENTDPRIQVVSANSLWADEAAGLRPDYADRVQKAFRAGVETIDLQSPESSQRIDRWMSDHTDGQVSGIAPQPHPDNAVILANALTFHGRWTNRFDRARTEDGPFLLHNGTRKTTPMMSEWNLPLQIYGEGEDFSVARLPYGDGSFSLLVFLPDASPMVQADPAQRSGAPADTDALPSLIARLSPALWNRCLKGLSPKEMPVQLPRFRIETEPGVEDAAKASGFAPAFARGADFRAMCRLPEGVHIASLRQKTILQVDEDGTRAGAITIMDARVTAIPDMFRVDHPFVCAIRDDRTGLILALAAIYDPKPS